MNLPKWELIELSEYDDANLDELELLADGYTRKQFWEG